ncbi:MAG: hypothetical protein J6125_04395 [Clostridia bacterium]|nr:hypothetical protein [Clostridia bacterium]
MSHAVIDLTTPSRTPRTAAKELSFSIASERARGSRTLEVVCPADRAGETAIRRALDRFKKEGRIVCYARGDAFVTPTPDALYILDKAPGLTGADFGGRPDVFVLLLG